MVFDEVKSVLFSYLTQGGLKDLFGSLFDKLIVAVVIVVLGVVVIRVINFLLSHLFDRTKLDRTLEIFVHKTTITVSWLVFFLVFLSVVGVDVSAIVASLGILGFVVGFALKDTLGNFASGIMILFNHPFKVGDTVEVKGVKGVVKTVEMSHTVIKNEAGQRVTLPNSVIWGAPIINKSAYKK